MQIPLVRLNTMEDEDISVNVNYILAIEETGKSDGYYIKFIDGSFVTVSEKQRKKLVDAIIHINEGWSTD